MLLPAVSSVSGEILVHFNVGFASQPIFLAMFGASLLFLGSLVHRRGRRINTENLVGSRSRSIKEIAADSNGKLENNSSLVPIAEGMRYGHGGDELMVSAQWWNPPRPVNDGNSSALMLK